jgi:hypothetical protein
VNVVLADPADHVVNIVAVDPVFERVVEDRLVGVMKGARERLVVDLIPGVLVADKHPVPKRLKEVAQVPWVAHPCGSR